MKVLFVQPYSMPESIAGDDTSMFEPLALEYLSANVKDICETSLIDMRLDKDIKKVISEYMPDIVGITGYSVHVNAIKLIVKEIRSANSSIKIVIGGCHASVAKEDFFDINPDYIIVGEGVYVFRELVKVLKKEKSLNSANGIEISIQDKTTILRQKFSRNLDRYPLPDRSLSDRYRHHYFSYWMKPVAALRSSAGCKFRCSFCSLWESQKGGYFTRKPENILREISEIKEEIIYFCDDESLLDASNMLELARLIKENGIKKRYHMMLRADTVVKNKGVIAAWKEIGLERIFMGVEACSDDILKRLNKGTTVSINNEAIKFLHSLGILILTNFIILQDFECKDFTDLKKYTRKLKLSSPTFTVLTPLPGTPFFREAEGSLIDTQFEHFDVMHSLLPTKLPLREFYKELYKLYKGSASIFQRINYIFRFKPKELVTLMKLYRIVMNKFKLLYKDTQM